MRHDTNEMTASEARGKMVAYHLRPTTIRGVFARHRSIQFDPLRPVACNHELVLQARVPGYRIGDWERLAYQDRLLYDGWDKQACLMPMELWPSRRLIRDTQRLQFNRIWEEFPEGVAAVLNELRKRGPLEPGQFDFQHHREDWKGSWFGPSVTKQILRALWHTGQIMTSARRSGRHVYDLTERVLPQSHLESAELTEEEMLREIILDRHRAVGLLRPSAPYEIWAFSIPAPKRHAVIRDLVAEGKVREVNVDGQKMHAVPELLEMGEMEAKPHVLGPLDPLMWDRKLVRHIWDFDYVWEVYVPEAKRRWGYYVLPILFGNDIVARADLISKEGILEIRAWHWEKEFENRWSPNDLLSPICGFLGGADIKLPPST